MYLTTPLKLHSENQFLLMKDHKSLIIYILQCAILLKVEEFLKVLLIKINETIYNKACPCTHYRLSLYRDH